MMLSLTLVALVVLLAVLARAELPNDEFKAAKAVQLLNDTIISCGAYQADACNCVYYARDRQPKLPTGCTTCDDKKRISNSNTAKAGCVMFRTGDPTYCHAAYVTKVSGSTIYIDQVRLALTVYVIDFAALNNSSRKCLCINLTFMSL